MPQHHPSILQPSIASTHPEQHKYPEQLNSKSNQRPPHENQQHARPERQSAFPFVLAREEDERSLGPEEERYADQEEDVAHREQGAVEEEDQAEQEEEATTAAEGDADLCDRAYVSIVALVVWREWCEGDGLCESESQ